MAALRRFMFRLVAVFRFNRSEDELAREVQSHLALMEDDFRRRGMTQEDAGRAARRAFGGLEQVKERHRDVRSFAWLADLRQDVRYALRMLRRSPGFTSVGVITLGLGIGATTAIYSVVDTILLQPLPFADSARLVRVVENMPSQVAGGPPVQVGMTYPDFLEWHARTRTLTDSVGVALISRIVKTSGGAARLWGATVSPDAFRLLGARALLGRVLDAGDAAHPDVAVLSFRTWQTVFHGEPGVVGTTVRLESDWNDNYRPELSRRLVTIVGVLPQAFEFPGIFMRPTGMDFYMPFAVDNVSTPGSTVLLMGRLRAGVSLAAALDEANVVGGSIRPPLPAGGAATNRPRFEVEIVKDQMVQEVLPALGVFLVAVAVLLLIVCANMANLLLARGTSRQSELALRLAIGADRGRIFRQILTECFVLALCGGALGAVLAAAGVMLVKALAVVDAPGIFQYSFAAALLPRVNEIAINRRMFAVAFSVAALTSLVFGVLPALHLSRTHHLNATVSRVASQRGESRMRAALVVSQLMMATVLLVAAALLTRSFAKLLTVENGYDPKNVLVFQLVLPTDYSIARKTETIEAVLARLRQTPRVEAAGFARAGFLIAEDNRVGTFVPPGRTLDEMRTDPARPRLLPIGDGYLKAMGVPVLVGREFEATDATPVIVISRTVARRYFDGDSAAVGAFLNWDVSHGPAVPMRVVGVAEDVRYESPGRDARPDVFVDYRQMLALEQRWGDAPRRQSGNVLGYLSFAVRTTVNPMSLAPVVDQIVHSVDPAAGIDAMIPMERLVGSAIARPRFYSVLLGVFATVAGALATIGIYGVLAYSVVRRTQEIGIRMVLGARRVQVLALVLRQGAILVLTGMGLGLVAAMAGARLLQGILFGIQPLDPEAFIAVSVVFVIMTTLACYLPARRATKVDPMVALRSV